MVLSARHPDADDPHEAALRGDAAGLARLRIERPAVAHGLAALFEEGPPPEHGGDVWAHAHAVTRAVISLGGDVPHLEHFGEGDEASCLAERARLWTGLVRGPAPEAGEVRSLARQAIELAQPYLVVEAQILEALCHDAVDDVERATAIARRATLAARSEGIVVLEYLAAIVLARLRRREGRAHLALRILGSLRGVVSSAWLPWIDWEHALAGGPSGASTAPARDLVALLAGAAIGDDETIRARTHVLTESRPTWVRNDASVVSRLAAGQFPPGTVAPAWAGGLAEPGSTGLWVVADERGGRTVLAAALALLRLPEGRRCVAADGRVASLLATLALHHPSGQTEEEAFRAVYGFAFSRSKHDGTFRVLLHRTRGLVEGITTLERGGGVLRLVHAGAIAVPDPRSVRSLEADVIRALGASPVPVPAAAIARSLGVTARAVQQIVQRLTQDGACVVRSEGYQLEDTAFEAPTRGRVAWPERPAPK